MSTTNCITKSITLSPGEPFVLPAGATLIGATDVDAIDSTCADLTDLEEYQCYEFKIAFHGGASSGANGPMQSSSVTKIDIYLDTTIIAEDLTRADLFTFSTIPSPSRTYHLWLTANMPTGLIVDEEHTSTGGEGGHTFDHICRFKTFPSIGDKMKIRMRSWGFDRQEDLEHGGAWIIPSKSENCAETED